jgi:tetratricopeptide (TPR) repeat protein
MQSGTKLLTLLLTVLLLLQANRSLAGNDTGGMPDLFKAQESTFQPDSCDRAREWYEEGLVLSDNSKREVYCYQQAIDLCPEFVAAHNRLGEVYKNQGKYILSIDAFKQARIQSFSSNRFAASSGSKALFLDSVISLGEIYRIQGKYKLAAEEFSKALEIDPLSPAAQNQLQYVYKRMHLYDNALSPHNRMLENAVFTRIPGMTLPRNTFSFDFLYRTWDQSAPIAPFTLDSWRVLSQFIFSPTLPDELKLLLFTDALIPERDPDNPIGPLEDFIQGFLIYDERKVNVKVGSLSMRYGVTNNLTLGIIPKFFSKTLDIQFQDFNSLNPPDAQTENDFGDTELFIKYRIWGKRHKHLSLYTMVNLPTGDIVEVTGDEPLITRTNIPDVPDSVTDPEQTKIMLTYPPESPPEPYTGSYVTETWEFTRYIPYGSESYDITPGLAFTMGFDPFVFLTNMQYRFTDGEQIGDEFRLNTAVIYPMTRNINVTMEMNYRWKGDVKLKQNITFFKIRPSALNLDPGTPAGPVAGDIEFTELGGQSLFLSPGLQVMLGSKVKLEIGMQIPVIRQPDGWMEDIVYHLGVQLMTF